MLSLPLMKMDPWEKLFKSILKWEPVLWVLLFSDGHSLSQNSLKFMQKNSESKEKKWCKNFGVTTGLIRKQKNGKTTTNLMMIKIWKEPSSHSLWSQLSDFAEPQWTEKWTNATKWWLLSKLLSRVKKDNFKENI